MNIIELIILYNNTSYNATVLSYRYVPIGGLPDITLANPSVFLFTLPFFFLHACNAFGLRAKKKMDTLEAAPLLNTPPEQAYQTIVVARPGRWENHPGPHTRPGAV
jgi:hypothetical protein